MATVAELNVKIGADIASFQAGMRKMESALKETGTRLKSAGKTLSLAVTVPILGVGAAAIKAASDVEEMQSKFNTVFKTVGGSVKQNLDAFAEATGRSRYELQGMAAELGDIIKPMGFTETQAGEMSTTLTKLAVDLGSFNNMPMDEALTRLRGALIGAHENVATFGVIINENTLKQEMMRMGTDKLTGAAREQAKVQARMNLILAQTTDAQGDATRTAGSFANQFIALKNATRDLGISIGQMLLPYATDLVGKLRDLVDYAQNLNPQVQRMAILIAGVAAAAGPLVFSLGGIASGFSAILRAITLTMGLFNPYVAGMAAIAAIAVGLYKNWDKVGATFQGLEQKVKDGLKPLTDWWDENRETIIRKIADLWVAIGATFDAALTALSTAISAGLNFLLEFWGQHGQSIVTILGTAFQLMLDFATTYFKNMAEVIKLGMELLKPGWDGEWSAIKSIAENNLNLVGTAVETLMGVVDKEMDMSGDPIDKKMGIESARKAISDALDKITSMFASTAQSAQDNLAGGENSVASSGEEAGEAIMGLRGEIEGLDAMPYKDGSIAGLIALIGAAPEDKTSLTGVASAAKESIDTLFKSIPTELSLPDWKVMKPDNDVSILSFWQNFKDRLYEVADGAGKISWNLDSVKRALDVLFGSKLGGWADQVVSVARDVTAVVVGFEALTKLLDLQTWKDFVNNLVEIGKNISHIVAGLFQWAAGNQAVAASQGAVGSTGTNIPGFTTPSTGGGPDFTNGDPGITIPGGGSGGGSGTDAATDASGNMGGLFATAMVFGRALFGQGGIFGPEAPSPWERAGISEEDWRAWWAATQAPLALAGFAGIDLTDPNLWAGSGLNFGDPWLGGGGRMAGGQTININLDGRTIAAATVPHMAQELEIYGTNF